jgi:hypothetical protein
MKPSKTTKRFFTRGLCGSGVLYLHDKQENNTSPSSIYDGDITTSKSSPIIDGKPLLILPLDSTNPP